jgi:hypothetical protein
MIYQYSSSAAGPDPPSPGLAVPGVGALVHKRPASKVLTRVSSALVIQYPRSLTFAHDANQAEKPAAGSSPYPKWLASPADPSPQRNQEGADFAPAPASHFCSDGLRIRNPCRPYRPSRHHPASQVPSSPASPRPSPRWLPAGRRPRPHPAAPSAPPWSGQRCRPSPGP